MASSFESKQAAKERHDKELADEVAGERHKQIHIHLGILATSHGIAMH